jgi:hypothetical protein
VLASTGDAWLRSRVYKSVTLRFGTAPVTTARLHINAELESEF